MISFRFDLALDRHGRPIKYQLPAQFYQQTKMFTTFGSNYLK